MPDFHPGIFLILCGIAAFALPWKKLRQCILVIVPIISLILTLHLQVGTTAIIRLFNRYTLSYITVTDTNRIFLLVFSVTAVVAGIYGAHNTSRLNAFASLAYVGSTLGAGLAGDWLTLLFFWEMMALSSLFLIWDNRCARSTRAGYRYLVTHLVGGNMMLIGVVWKIWMGTPQISILTSNMDLSSWMILIGMAVNSAIIPLHFWVADAYPESTLTGGVYMSSFTTKFAVLCVMQSFLGLKVLLVLGLIMMLYGACMAMIENDMRRLLSYHIISQLGFMVADIGIGTEMGANAATALAVGNVLYKSLLFMCAGAIIYATGIRKINQLGQLHKKLPLVCIVFFIAAFSIAGFPFFAGFTCKSLSMVAAEEAGLNLVHILMVIGGIGTTLSIPFKMGYFIFFGKERNIETRPLPKSMQIGMVMGGVICMIVGLCPKVVYSLLPYSMDYTPYTAGHFIEYLMLIPAALLAFLMYLDKMEPHTALTLDIDWFFRKPLKVALFGLSAGVTGFVNSCGKCGRNVYHLIQLAVSNPYRLLHRKPQNSVTKKEAGVQYFADAYRSKIGSGMLYVICAVIIVAIYLIIRR